MDEMLGIKKFLEFKQGTTCSMLTLPSGRNENLTLVQVVNVLDKGRMDKHST